MEVGVHRGKSFALLASFSGQSKLYAVDIFGDQGANIDFSGNGNYEIFMDNMRDLKLDTNRIVVDARVSSELTAEDVLGSVGPVRFFHVDGGHHHDAVCSDLELAAGVGASEAVIAVDDVFRPEWPQVTTATFGSGVLENEGYVMFAVGYNKTYFCRKDMAEIYQAQLMKAEYLFPFFVREYKTDERPILVYQRYPMAEWGLVERVKWYLSIWHPETYVKVWRLAKAIQRK